jgi:hypothetical protein
MPAMVKLLCHRPGDTRSEDLLDETRKALGWQVPLELEPDNRIEIAFVGIPPSEAMERVKAALDVAGEELDLDWTDYFVFGGRG